MTFLITACLSFSQWGFAEIATKTIHPLASYIDHTYLDAAATTSDIERVCKEAKEYAFKSVCIQPSYVRLAAGLLKEAGDPLVCTVVGFPLGATTTQTKVLETKEAVINGAREIDMVANLGGIKEGNWELVKKDIQEVVKAAGDVPVKVIIETAKWNDEQITQACKVAKEAGAQFVKTSTGFDKAGGASVAAVALMRQVVGTDFEVKASGGIRDLLTAEKMIEAGASRLGTSAGVAIVENESATSQY